MLTKFSVSNFKGFKNPFTLDLSSPGSYAFNKECLKNGVINNAIIYGYNGVGKSNFGYAIFDLMAQLTDRTKPTSFYENYLNAEAIEDHAHFEYEFLINGHRLLYQYDKDDYTSLRNEYFYIDDKRLISRESINGGKFECHLEGTESLRKEFNDSSVSVLKFIKNNSELINNEINQVFKDFFIFIEKMLLFKGLDHRVYIGPDPKLPSIDETIIEEGRVKDFQKFINEAGIKGELAILEYNGTKKLIFDFPTRKILFGDFASTGTRSLLLFYGWYIQILKNNINFVFIDEFDAFYHYELSRLIINKLKESGVQFILTTHNTTIMNNNIMRPDCLFLMGEKAVKPLCNCTEKELREAHNLEKIYRAHAFKI